MSKTKSNTVVVDDSKIVELTSKLVGLPKESIEVILKAYRLAVLSNLTDVLLKGVDEEKEYIEIDNVIVPIDYPEKSTLSRSALQDLVQTVTVGDDYISEEMSVKFSKMITKRYNYDSLIGGSTVDE